MMKRTLFFYRRWPRPIWAIVSLVALTVACNMSGRETATPAPQAPTLPPATLAPAQPTAAPVDTAEAAPAETAEPATLTPEATATEVEATETPAALAETPESAVTESFAPGQQDASELAPDGFRVYPFAATEFQSVVVFAEPSGGLDLSLAVYEQAVSAPDEAEPRASANFNEADRPEILVYSPDETGQHSIVVSAVSGEGEYRVLLFDTQTAAPWLSLQEAQLDGGETANFTVSSSGARPVVVFAEPTGRADLVLQIFGADGTLITEANFGGPGSAEAAFVLPMRQSDYGVQVTEASGAAAAFRLAIAALNGG